MTRVANVGRQVVDGLGDRGRRGQGGQISSIAYCVKSKKHLLERGRERAGDRDAGTPATTTTPDCPPGKKLIAGGYSAPPSLRVFQGAFEGLNNWTAGAASYTGSVGSPLSVTASSPKAEPIGFPP